MNKTTIIISITSLILLSLLLLQTPNEEADISRQIVAGKTENTNSLVKPSSPLVQTQRSMIKDEANEATLKQLWKTANNSPELTQDLPAEILVAHIQAEPDAFDNLDVGQKVDLYIPQESQAYTGIVKENFKQFNGQVNVSSGSIENGDQFSSFTVTKGLETTIVMVATNQGIYQVEINNKTGAGTVIDDQSLNYFRKHDDTQTTPPEGIS